MELFPSRSLSEIAVALGGGIFLIGFGGMMLWGVAQTIRDRVWRRIRLAAAGGRAKATVVDWETLTDPEMTTQYTLVVDFTTRDGVAQHAVTLGLQTEWRPRKGGRVRILYDPDEPRRAVPQGVGDALVHALFLVPVLLVAGVWCGLAGVVLLVSLVWWPA